MISKEELLLLMQSRILVLDGAMGTMLQKCGRGGGNNEELNLSAPQVVADIHRAYIDAGADIISTNSFAAGSLSQDSYGRAADASSMARAAASIARSVADKASRPVLVAGSIGPTGKSLSLPCDAFDASLRPTDFDAMVRSFREQALALLEGGADFILLETFFDALNAKAAIYALQTLEGKEVPVIVSATVSDCSLRTITGLDLKTFYEGISHAPGLCAFGVNCALGASRMAPLVRDIASFSSHPVIFYPNAGLPDALGNYTDDPAQFASCIASLAQEGCLNLAGGCCGTTDTHIRSLSQRLRSLRPRPLRTNASAAASGADFIAVGERTNVTGSARFRRIMESGDMDAALKVAVDQIEAGARVIDVNMDDPLGQPVGMMRSFLRCFSGEPAASSTRVMIDSSSFDVIMEGLKNVQTKAIVNSISLKDGPEEFLRRALLIRSMGASMVVMAFDEKGQAETFERKIEICRRSYDLLTAAGIPAGEIIFDCNILTIATGIPEHSRFGVDFIDAVRWIKANLPGARTSGGVSNLSFAFRGNDPLRRAMHSVFLHYAREAGLDMAIVNPSAMIPFDSVPEQLLSAVRDVIFDSDPDATARLVEMASAVLSEAADPASVKTVPESTASDRLRDALLGGESSTLEKDVLECLRECGDNPVAVVEGPLMGGMAAVGDRFAVGRMFLPQVLKAARVMKEAVAVLQPYMNTSASPPQEEQRVAGKTRPRFLIATVQGDVHDIGKNITATVLQCSGFDVEDLGVMVPCEEILRRAEEFRADAIGVSGLITPSLYRMEELCREMSSRGMTLPLFVGGAAVSAKYVKLRLKPLYANVHYGADASATAVLAARTVGGAKEEKSDTLFETLTPQDLLPHFDWNMFYAVCGIRKTDDPDGFYKARLKADAAKILSDGSLSVSLAARFMDCTRKGDDIICTNGSAVLPMLRGKGPKGPRECSLADFFPQNTASRIGVFAIAVQDSAEADAGDIVRHAVRSALAEAASAYLASDADCLALMGDGKVLLPAVGYPCCPDHSLKRDILALLPENLGISLTDSCAMIPEESICGLVIGLSGEARASYPDIRSISAARAEEYSRRRGFSPRQQSLFLQHLISD